MGNRVGRSGGQLRSPIRTARRRRRLPVFLFYVFFMLYCLGGLYFGYVFVYGLSLFLGGQSGLATSGVPALAGPLAPLELAAPWTGEDRLNILLLGLDQRDDEVGQPSRSDTLIVLTVDPVNKSAAMLSIPRDLWVPIPGVGENKINTAHFFGEVQEKDYGPILAKKTIEQNFSIPIHYYARVNFRGFERLIDAIGGIDIDVPRPVLDDEYPVEDGGIKRLYVPAGWQHMNGRTALEYARSRHADSDFGRSKRQQQVLVAAKERALQLDMLPRLPGMMGLLMDSVTTDIPPGSILSMAQLARSIGSGNIESVAIDGTMVTEYNTPEMYWLEPNWPEIRELVATVFAIPQQHGDAPVEQQETARVEVLNGTDRVGLATVTGSFLKDKGFVVVRIDNAERDEYQETIIIDRAGKPAAAANIAQLLGVPEAVITEESGQGDDVDISILLGKDVQLPGRD